MDVLIYVIIIKILNDAEFLRTVIWLYIFITQITPIIIMIFIYGFVLDVGLRDMRVSVLGKLETKLQLKRVIEIH